MNNPRIALVLFPLNDIGGISVWTEKIQTGFKRLGIKHQLYYCSPQTRFRISENEKINTTHQSILPGKFLSYNSESLKETIKTLDEYDVVLFIHPSPHPTRSNNAKPDIRNWQKLYTETKAKKVVIFHDALWQKTNAWFAEVANYVDIAVAAQYQFFDSLQKYPSKCLKYWSFFPMDLQLGENIKEKKEFGMLSTQWLQWKNHKFFLPHLPKIDIPIKLFGTGIEYYYLSMEKSKSGREPVKMIQKYINHDYFRDKIGNEKSIHDFYGFVPYERLVKFYRKSQFSIDLSTRGYINYTHVEPMMFDSVSFIEKTIFENNKIAVPDDCCVQYDMANVEDTVNRIIGRYDKKEFKEIRRNATNYIRSYYDCTKVAQRLLNKLKEVC